MLWFIRILACVFAISITGNSTPIGDQLELRNELYERGLLSCFAPAPAETLNTPLNDHLDVQYRNYGITGQPSVAGWLDAVGSTTVQYNAFNFPTGNVNPQGVIFYRNLGNRARTIAIYTSSQVGSSNLNQCIARIRLNPRQSLGPTTFSYNSGSTYELRLLD